MEEYYVKVIDYIKISLEDFKKYRKNKLYYVNLDIGSCNKELINNPDFNKYIKIKSYQHIPVEFINKNIVVPKKSLNCIRKEIINIYL
jgi:hypothetical protein